MKTIPLSIGNDVIACHQSIGTGPAVVLVHGNSCSAETFRHQLDGPLGERLALTAIDLPGHGASTDAHDPDAIYQLPGYANTLVALAEQLNLQHALFVGWSLGGHIVLEAAPALPRAAGFMLIGTPPLGCPPDIGSAFHPHAVTPLLFQRDWNEAEAAAFSAFAFGADKASPAIERDIRRTDSRTRAGLASSVAQRLYRDELQVVRELKQPLAIVLGENDPLMNRAYFDTVTMPTLWRNHVQLVPDSEHAPHWQNTTAFNAMLSDFVADCAQGAT